ncbi:hypothetical protein [Paenibacillus camerounensis]|uniref:hypothetical protein n=1 Tax=Paenibacillus camerounensis TaxID=1243663 RepID=UPI0006944A77|nr:hypothetical protein [Paenibacillus camerounensis]
MIRFQKAMAKTGRAILLGTALTLAGGAAAVGTFVQPVSAASAAEAQAVYNQFHKYLKNPSGLAQARKYLINHIGNAGSWYATVMTLQLENAQKAELSRFSEKIYPEHVQQVLMDAQATNDLTYTELLKRVKDSGVRKLIEETWDKGYKLETSEGMYYPVMHYEGFKVFKPHIGKDIAYYIDIMATESNKPADFDAAIIITWDELIGRAAIMSDFVDQYPKSNRAAAVREELSYIVPKILIGADNTPAYDYDTNELDPELRRAYDDVLLEGPGDNTVLNMLAKLIPLLDASGNKHTEEVSAYLEQVIDGFTEH